MVDLKAFSRRVRIVLWEIASNYQKLFRVYSAYLLLEKKVVQLAVTLLSLAHFRRYHIYNYRLNQGFLKGYVRVDVERNDFFPKKIQTKNT